MAATLLAEGVSPVEAASLVGVTPASITLWRRDPRFQALEKMATQEVIRHLLSEHVGAFRLSLRTLVAAARGEDVSREQLDAAKTLWSTMFAKSEALFTEQNHDGGDWYDDAQSE